MAPLENGGFQPSVWAGDRSRPIDSLMRALLYIAQQVGRPVSEADVRRLAAIAVNHCHMLRRWYVHENAGA